MRSASSGPIPQCNSALQAAVISFDCVIRVLLSDVAGRGQQLIEHSRIRRSPVGAHLGRLWTVVERLGEEPASGGEIPFLGGEDIDDLAELVDRPVQIDPPSRDFDVVRSTRSALPVFLLVGFSGSPPEPDVPVGRASGSPQAPLGGMFPSRTDRPRTGDLCPPV